MKLSEHFDSDEFKCTCNGRYCSGLPEQGIDPKLITLLEEIRARFPGKSIHVNSGYRCAERNAEVEGAKNSQHMLGIAADIVINGENPRYVAQMAELAFGILRKTNKDFKDVHGGIGIYSGFTHVDVRQKVSRWNG